MCRRELWVVVLTGAVAAMGEPATARACSCIGLEMLAPADGQRDVPRNTKLWVVGHGFPSSAFTLTGPGGDIPVSVERLNPQTARQRWVITPTFELTGNSSYELAVCNPFGPPENRCSKLTRFDVGTGRAEQPAPPTERRRSTLYREGQSDSCGPSSTRMVKFEVDWDGLLLLADIEGANRFPTDPLDVLSTAISDRDYARAGGFHLGKGSCVFQPWPGKDTAQVRFGVVNLAGQFSGWGEPSTATLPDETGCQLVGGRGARAPWTAGAVGLLCLALRRRRRSAGSRVEDGSRRRKTAAVAGVLAADVDDDHDHLGESGSVDRGEPCCRRRCAYDARSWGDLR
jgi:hypothetical protein